MKTTFLTLFALLAFAGNSVLCRLALGENLIDPAGFTSLRLLSGAITLAVLLLLKNKTKTKPHNIEGKQQVLGVLLLFSYAICFSYAYVVLATGAGALVLFGAVQLTMLLTSVAMGRKPSFNEWLGVGLAFTGLVYLFLPSWGTPSLTGFVLMLLAGVSWGFYSIIGTGSSNALKQTAVNFIGCIPLVLLLNIMVFQPTLWTTNGVLLALTSGVITSAIGYAIWYAVLPKLSASQAGVLQLLVPIIAALGGVAFVAEPLTIQLVISSFMVLGGVYLVMWSKRNS